MPSEALYAIDLESWTGDPRYQQLSSDERRVLDDGVGARQTRDVLALCETTGVRLTWFVQAELADWYPEEVDRIVAAGHEIGYHTHTHPISNEPAVLLEELRRSDAFLRRWKPIGFQAPAITMGARSYAILRDHGFRYSASSYGTSVPRVIDGIVELPVSAASLKGTAIADPVFDGFPSAIRRGIIPFGSSLFMGAVGWRVVDRLCRRAAGHSEIPNLFIHNWQLFSEGPRADHDRLMAALRRPAFTPYLRNLRNDFVQLAKRYRWGRFCDALQLSA